MTDQDKSLSPQGIRFPDWQPESYASLLETDPLQLKQRALRAEEAIFVRRQVLLDVPNTEAERQAMADATSQLRSTQVEKLNYPDWKK